MTNRAEAAPIEQMQSFSDAISWEQLERDRYRGEVAAIWGQGRAVYGGIVAAGIARAMQDSVPAEKQLRSFSVTFAGPVEVGTVDCSTSLLRDGRTASFVQAEVVQNGTSRAVASGTFGIARESAAREPGPPRPDLPTPAAAKEMPYIEGAMPKFTQALEFRYTHGQFPFAGSDDSHIAGWFRFRNDTSPGDASGILGLLDAWPAPALSTLKKFAPASSITWNVDLVDLRPDARIDEWWYFDAHTTFAADGYTSFDASLWAPDGRYVARSRQLVGVFG